MSSRKATEVIRLDPLARQWLDRYITDEKTRRSRARITPNEAVKLLLSQVAPELRNEVLHLQPELKMYDKPIVAKRQGGEPGAEGDEE